MLELNVKTRKGAYYLSKQQFELVNNHLTTLQANGIQVANMAEYLVYLIENKTAVIIENINNNEELDNLKENHTNVLKEYQDLEIKYANLENAHNETCKLVDNDTTSRNEIMIENAKLKAQNIDLARKYNVLKGIHEERKTEPVKTNNDFFKFTN